MQEQYSHEINSKPTDQGIKNKKIEEPQWSNYYPPIVRKFAEGLLNVSTNTLIKFEQDGLLTPHKIKYGAMDVVAYTVDDISALLKKRGKTLKTGPSAETIAIFSQKGGTGKSAFAQHMSFLFSLFGKTLVIDVDSQGDISSLLGGIKTYNHVADPNEEQEPTILELMDWSLKDGNEYPYRKMNLEQVVTKITPNLHLIPADLDISEINYSLNRLPLKDRVDSEGNILPGVLVMIKEVVESVKNLYDYIIIDTPPNIETCNLNVLFSVNRILIPLEIEAKCLKSMHRNQIFLYRLKDLHPGFKWDKILIVPNKFKRESIKIKALSRLQDIYFDSKNEFQLSKIIFSSAAIMDKCSELKEPIFSLATKLGKDYKPNAPQAKEFSDYFWIIAHELLDLDMDHLLFETSQETLDN